MRNMRSALFALGLAGAAYAWRNRDRLMQQWNQARRQLPPAQLPDYQSQPERQFPQGDNNTFQPRERQFGGSDL